MVITKLDQFQIGDIVYMAEWGYIKVIEITGQPVQSLVLMVDVIVKIIDNDGTPGSKFDRLIYDVSGKKWVGEVGHWSKKIEDRKETMFPHDRGVDVPTPYNDTRLFTTLDDAKRYWEGAMGWGTASMTVQQGNIIISHEKRITS